MLRLACFLPTLPLLRCAKLACILMSNDSSPALHKSRTDLYWSEYTQLNAHWLNLEDFYFRTVKVPLQVHWTRWGMLAKPALKPTAPPVTSPNPFCLQPLKPPSCQDPHTLCLNTLLLKHNCLRPRLSMQGHSALLLSPLCKGVSCLAWGHLLPPLPCTSLGKGQLSCSHRDSLLSHSKSSLHLNGSL